MSNYYETCAIPKPTDRKKRKKVNGYKDKPNRVCYYHPDRYGAERHEVFGGPNRQTSIDHGFQVDLCPECHRAFHSNDGWGAAEKAKWQKHFQEKYEDKLIELGLSLEDARNTWMTMIGRNYL